MRKKVKQFLAITITAAMLLSGSSFVYGAEMEPELQPEEEQRETLLEETGDLLSEEEEEWDTDTDREEEAEEAEPVLPKELQLNEEATETPGVYEGQEEYQASAAERAAQEEIMKVPVTGYRRYTEAFKVLELVNKERTSRGLSALKMDKDLLDAGMLRAAELGIYYSHTRPTGEGCYTADPKIMGENIAAGTAFFFSEASDVMDLWMLSPGHKQNILTERYKSLGVGSVQIDEVTYWVQVFGTENAETASSQDYTNGWKKTNISFTENDEDFSMFLEVNGSYDVGVTAPVRVGFDNSFSNIWIENSSFNFTSENPTVCTINANGELTAKRGGRAKITAALKNYPQASASATVTVDDPAGQTVFRNTTPQVSAKANGDGSALISWKKVTNAYSYGIYRKEAGGSFQGLATVGANVTSYTDKTAKPGKTYYYTVKGFWDENGQGITTKYPTNVSVKIPTEEQQFANITTQVTAKVNEDRSVSVNWGKLNKAASYRIYRKEAGGSFAGLATVGAEATTYRDTAVQGGKTYYYTVKGFWKEGAAGTATKYPSNVNVTIPVDPNNPQEVFLNTVTKVSASANGDKTITVSWDEVDNAASYRIYRKEAGGSFAGLATLGADTTSYTDQTAKPGKTYYYTVKGFWEENAQGITTKYPSDVSARIPAESLETPKVTVQSMNYCTIDVSWNSIEGAETYVIYRKEAKAGTSFKSMATVSEGTLKYRDSTAKLGVSYYYTVKACAGDVTSDYVKNVKGTAVPSAPTVKTAGSTKGVTVTWTGSKASANSYATGYRVFRKTAGGSWKTVGTVGKDTRSFTDTTGAKGTTYYYTVRAYVKQSDGSNLWGSYNTAGVAGTRK